MLYYGTNGVHKLIKLNKLILFSASKILEEDKKITAGAKEKASSCLHGNTKILLVNNTWKKISDLKPNEMIVDKDLQPQRILGINYTYLQGRSLYRFADDGPLFTTDHQFFSLLGSTTTAVASLRCLLQENPQLEGENIIEMKDGGTVLRYDVTSKKMEEIEIILTETRDFPLHEKVYFLEVTGDGSYVADNYIAKHELPDFTRRPFTNICFAHVLQSYNKTKERNKVSLSLEGFNSILKHVKRIKALWEFIVEFGDQMEGKKYISNMSLLHFCF